MTPALLDTLAFFEVEGEDREGDRDDELDDPPELDDPEEVNGDDEHDLRRHPTARGEGGTP